MWGLWGGITALPWIANGLPIPRLQEYFSTTQGWVQVHLITFSQSELSVELRPRLPTQEASDELEPLRLRVTWGHGDRFRLQVAKDGTS